METFASHPMGQKRKQRVRETWWFIQVLQRVGDTVNLNPARFLLSLLSDREDSRAVATIWLNEGRTCLVERQKCLLRIFEQNVNMAWIFFVWEEINIVNIFITSQSPSIPCQGISLQDFASTARQNLTNTPGPGKLRRGWQCPCLNRLITVLSEDVGDEALTWEERDNLWHRQDAERSGSQLDEADNSAQGQ